MECGLQWKDITCWDEVPWLTLTHEETLEAAIPDYCPDMGRVVEASGTLCLRSITARSGSLELKGTARVTVLYTSEESVGRRPYRYRRTVPGYRRGRASGGHQLHQGACPVR